MTSPGLIRRLALMVYDRHIGARLSSTPAARGAPSRLPRGGAQGRRAEERGSRTIRLLRFLSATEQKLDCQRVAAVISYPLRGDKAHENRGAVGGCRPRNARRFAGPRSATKDRAVPDPRRRTPRRRGAGLGRRDRHVYRGCGHHQCSAISTSVFSLRAKPRLCAALTTGMKYLGWSEFRRFACLAAPTVIPT